MQDYQFQQQLNALMTVYVQLFLFHDAIFIKHAYHSIYQLNVLFLLILYNVALLFNQNLRLLNEYHHGLKLLQKHHYQQLISIHQMFRHLNQILERAILPFFYLIHKLQPLMLAHLIIELYLILLLFLHPQQPIFMRH